MNCFSLLPKDLRGIVRTADGLQPCLNWLQMKRSNRRRRWVGISITQPWATATAMGLRTFDTRDYEIKWRGSVAIVANRVAEADDLPGWFIQKLAADGVMDKKPWPIGGVIATARLTGIFPAELVTADEYGNFVTGRYAWRLEDVKPVEPMIPAVVRGPWEHLFLPADLGDPRKIST